MDRFTWGCPWKWVYFFKPKWRFHPSKLGIWHMKNQYCMFFYWITYFLHQIEARQSACLVFFEVLNLTTLQSVRAFWGKALCRSQRVIRPCWSGLCRAERLCLSGTPRWRLHHDQRGRGSSLVDRGLHAGDGARTQHQRTLLLLHQALIHHEAWQMDFVGCS